MKLLRLFKRNRPCKIPVYLKKNVRIEIVGPLNQVLYTLDFINPNRALHMFELLLKDHSHCADGPFKLNYYKISTGIAMPQITYELRELPSGTDEYFKDFDCGL